MEPSNGKLGLRMAVWLKVKVRGGGLGLRPIGCASAVCDTKAPLQLHHAACAVICCCHCQLMDGSVPNCHYRRRRSKHHYTAPFINLVAENSSNKLYILLKYGVEFDEY